MTGTTPICFSCGRPIINAPVAYGNAGEGYHFECTRPPVQPQTYGMPSPSQLERHELRILRGFAKEVQQAEDMLHVKQAIERLHSE